jgi:hypothetical protein
VRARYEVYCGGRLLKVFEQISVSTYGDVACGEPTYIDGHHFWKIDEQAVAADTAQALLAKYGEQSSDKGIRP